MGRWYRRTEYPYITHTSNHSVHIYKVDMWINRTQVMCICYVMLERYNTIAYRAWGISVGTLCRCLIVSTLLPHTVFKYRTPYDYYLLNYHMKKTLVFHVKRFVSSTDCGVRPATQIIHWNYSHRVNRVISIVFAEWPLDCLGYACCKHWSMCDSRQAGRQPSSITEPHLAHAIWWFGRLTYYQLYTLHWMVHARAQQFV